MRVQYRLPIVLPPLLFKLTRPFVFALFVALQYHLKAFPFEPDQPHLKIHDHFRVFLTTHPLVPVCLLHSLGGRYIRDQPNAADKGHLEVVKALLVGGATADVLDHDKWSPRQVSVGSHLLSGQIFL